MYIFIWLSIHVCVCIDAYPRIYVYVYTHCCTHVHAYDTISCYICIYIYIYIVIKINIHIYIYIYIYIYTYISVYNLYVDISTLPLLSRIPMYRLRAAILVAFPKKGSFWGSHFGCNLGSMFGEDWNQCRCNSERFSMLPWEWFQ